MRQERAAVEGAYAFLTELDVLAAKLGLALRYDGRMPRFEKNAPVRLKNARHPLLALGETSGDGTGTPSEKRSRSGKTVPVDIMLRDNERGLIISGGNAGGKTVTLKTCLLDTSRCV